MKKIFIAVWMLVLMVGEACAYDVSTERAVNLLYNSQCTSGTMVTHRSAVSSIDASNPVLGSGVDCTGHKYAIVDFDGNKGTFWTVTPIYGNSTANAYMAGSSTVASGDCRLLVDTFGSNDVYMRLDAVTNGGSGTTTTIYVTPTN